MSPEQCRAARGWLQWSQHDLASRAKVSTSTIRDFEAARRIPHPNNLQAIQHACEMAGIIFLFNDAGKATGITWQASGAKHKKRK